jgi:hypothetical protein
MKQKGKYGSVVETLSAPWASYRDYLGWTEARDVKKKRQND